MNTRSKIFIAIAVATVAALGLILWTLFEWSLTHRFPAAVYMELSGIVWMVFFLLATVSFVALYELPEVGPLALLPILIQVTGVLVVFYAPLNRLWIEGDFLLYRGEREAVVDKILRNELTGDEQLRRGVIILPETYSELSTGGNEIIVDERMGKRFIFFYTYRGGRDNYAGFIHVPPGLHPSDSGLGPRQLEQVLPMAENWFHVAPARGDN